MWVSTRENAADLSQTDSSVCFGFSREEERRVPVKPLPWRWETYASPERASLAFPHESRVAAAMSLTSTVYIMFMKSLKCNS